MYTRTIGRFGAAVVLAVGLLLATSLPASASANGVVIEASSTIVFQTSTGGTPVENIHLAGHETTSPCPGINSQPASVIPLGLDSTGSATVAPAATNWFPLIIGTNSFKRRLNIVGGSMSFSATGTTVTLTMNSQFRTCDSTVNLCTTNNFTVTLTGPSVGHHPTDSTQVTVAGISTHISGPFTCNNIIRAIYNSTHSVAILNLHFVTV